MRKLIRYMWGLCKSILVNQILFDDDDDDTINDDDRPNVFTCDSLTWTISHFFWCHQQFAAADSRKSGMTTRTFIHGVTWPHSVYNTAAMLEVYDSVTSITWAYACKLLCVYFEAKYTIHEACRKHRQQTNSRSVKSRTGQLTTSQLASNEFFLTRGKTTLKTKPEPNVTLTLTLSTVESVQSCNLPQITLIAIIYCKF